MPDETKPKEYQLSAAEKDALDKKYAEVTLAKARVYDVNIELEKMKIQAQQSLGQAEQATQMAVVRLKESEDRVAGALDLLAEAHGLKGAKLSDDRTKLVLAQ